MNDSAIRESVRSPGYTPRKRDLEALFTLLAVGDDDVASDVERALSRVGVAAVGVAMAHFPAAAPPLRGRLCQLVGRIAVASPDEALVEWLVLRLRDPDGKTRRRAVRALGKIGGGEVEAALIAAFADDVELADARALAIALGSAGGERALARLDAVKTDDPELSRVVREAKLKLSRAALRKQPGGIDARGRASGAVKVLLHVRAGLEDILLEELGARSGARAAGRGRVEVLLDGPLEELFRARTFLHLGFPLPPEPVREGEDAEAAVARALASDAAWSVFSAYTRGPVRFRLEWASRGRQRAATFRVAAAVASLRSGLVNDPSAAAWEAVVTEKPGDGAGRLFVELWPRGLEDPRFVWRRRALPASSHPTIAAALARVGGVVPDDVVWDPFVGAGGELVERALLGPYARLVGTDTDPRALDAARENLGTANIQRFELSLSDARTFTPREPPTLVLTNPPFGKRVLEPAAIGPLLDAVLAHAARVMKPGGRFVWMSPLADVTAEAARRHGFAARLRRAVDVGGVPAELQAFTLASERRAGRRPTRGGSGDRPRRARG